FAASSWSPASVRRAPRPWRSSTSGTPRSRPVSPSSPQAARYDRPASRAAARSVACLLTPASRRTSRASSGVVPVPAGRQSRVGTSRTVAEVCIFCPVVRSRIFLRPAPEIRIAEHVKPVGGARPDLPVPGYPMDVILRALGEALRLIGGLDPDLLAIVALSLQVSLGAVAIATVLGLPIGAAV